MNKLNLNILQRLKFLIRVSKKKTKKKELLKRLRNIEDKNEQQLKTIENKTENIKEVTDFVEEPLSLEAKALIEEIRTIQKDVDYRKLKITGGNKVTYDFSDYKTFKEFFRDLYYKKMTIDDAELKQDEFNAVLGVLSKYTSGDQKYNQAKNKLLNNATNFFRGREKIIKGFKDGIFPLNYDDVVEEQARYEEEGKNVRNENGLIDYKNFGRLIDLKNRDINDKLVRRHFLVQDLGELLEKLKKSKNNPEKNSVQINLITIGLRDLKKEIGNMSEVEKEIENPNEIIDIVENILEFNRQQEGQGLKNTNTKPNA